MSEKRVNLARLSVYEKEYAADSMRCPNCRTATSHSHRLDGQWHADCARCVAVDTRERLRLGLPASGVVS